MKMLRFLPKATMLAIIGSACTTITNGVNAGNYVDYGGTIPLGDHDLRILQGKVDPADCSDVNGIANEDIINQKGSSKPIPENAVKIIQGDNLNVTIEVSQLWSEDTNFTFFLDYHTLSHESVCEPIPDFGYGEIVTKELECFDGWTDVGIYIYFDSYMNMEDCEGCSPSDTKEEDFVGYYFELPCDPVCEKSEPSEAPFEYDPAEQTPTLDPVTRTPAAFFPPSGSKEADCGGITKDDIINQRGSSKPIPEDAVKIVQGEDLNVTIQISQLWEEDMSLTFFIDYHALSHQSVCEPIPGFGYEQNVTIELECFDGWTDVVIYIYFDPDLNIDECEGCNPLDSKEEDYVAYYFELPCDPCDKTLGPSEAPSMYEPTAFTLEPTESTPTLDLVSQTPTAFFPPTKSPIGRNELDCDSGITKDDIINQRGSTKPFPEDAVRIIKGENVNVTIEISQLWEEDMNLTFFVDYHALSHQSVCEPIPDFEYEVNVTKDLECFDGWTDVGIYIYFDPDLNIDECEGCNPLDSMEGDYVAYYFELPCDPCESLAPSEAPTTY